MAKLTKVLKNGVTVKVLTGKDKNKTGKVIQVLWDKNRVKVEKVNMVKRHTRPNAQNKAGGIVEQEGTIHMSNLVVLDAQAAPAKKAATATTKGKAPKAAKAAVSAKTEKPKKAANKRG